MLEELGGDPLVGRPGPRQLQRDGQHVQAEQPHPRRAVGLLEPPAVGQVGTAAVEHADVVQAQEAALERVAAVGVLAVDPPGEVQEQLVEDLLEEVGVLATGHLAVDLVDAARRRGRAPADWRRRSPTRRPGAGRWDACTIRARAARSAAWPTRDRAGPARCSGTPCPTRRTRDTPTCRARSGRRGCRRAASRRCGPGAARPAAPARPGRRRARARRCSGRTAWTTAARHTPGAGPSAGRRRVRAAGSPGRTRRPRRAARRRSRRTDRTGRRAARWPAACARSSIPPGSTTAR